jgi:hypothetical protein
MVRSAVPWSLKKPYTFFTPSPLAPTGSLSPENRYTGVDGSIRDRASWLEMYCRPPIMSRNMPAVGIKVQKGSFR